MRRRELILLLGGALTAARALRAQQKTMPGIGLLGTALPTPNAPVVAPAPRAPLPRFTFPRRFGRAGGPTSYAPNLPDAYRRAGFFVGKPLKWANPPRPPVGQPTTFELVINLNTAKALGLTVSRLILGRAV